MSGSNNPGSNGISKVGCAQIFDTDDSSGIDGWRTTIANHIATLQAATSKSAANDAILAQVKASLVEVDGCVNDKISNLSNASGNIAKLNEDILSATEKLHQAEKDIQVAKDRVGYIRHPERNTSNYESWFPIDRPISIFSMILLVCLTLFLGTFLLLLILSFAGINLVIFSPGGREENPIVTMILEQLTFSFWVVLIILVSVVIYFTSKK